MQSARILEIVRTEGFALVASPSDADFVALAGALGTIVDDTPVRVVPGKRTYLARPDPIPFHTDHPIADLVAWRCEAQDARCGASLIVDGRTVVGELDGNVCADLERLLLPAMVRLGDDPLPTPILSGEKREPRLFYAPWLEPAGKPLGGRQALGVFRETLRRAEGRARSIRLEPGQALVVDNRRMLHGRGPLLSDSARRLRRLWLRGPCPP